MTRECVLCHRERSDKHMTPLYRKVHEGVRSDKYISVNAWACASIISCKNARRKAKNGNLPEG